ncbi:uncharacterized protein [Antedon mediterranea]|uniref:uncharacterized protein n=1 Tax=Antedon mediterranea TaxID=105859 RepID=UPI003AF8DCF7
MTSESCCLCGKAGILSISALALVAALVNAGVWVSCAVEYCDIYNATDIKNEWEVAVLWYTPPVVALVLMIVPTVFGICMGTVCYDSAVGTAIAVFSTLSVIGSFAYICLELLALYGDKENIYFEIFNRVLTSESDTGEWLWRIQLGLTCLIVLLSMVLIFIGYCSCGMIDDDEMEYAKEEEEGGGGFPSDPNYGQFDSYKAPYMISKAPHNNYGENGLSNRHSRYNDDLIADHLRPRPQQSSTHMPQDPWSRQPTFTSRQEQHVESMENKYARYGAQPAVGPPISRSSSTRRSHQELPSHREDTRSYNDPGPPPHSGSEPLYPSNHRQRRPKQQRNKDSSILDYGKKRSNYTGIRDIRSHMTNGLPRPQVDYDYSQDNEGFSTRYDYY